MVALPASAGGGTLLFYTGAWVSGDSALNCTGATESRLIAMPGFRYNVNLSFPKTGSRDQFKIERALQRAISHSRTQRSSRTHSGLESPSGPKTSRNRRVVFPHRRAGLQPQHFISGTCAA